MNVWYHRTSAVTMGILDVFRCSPWAFKAYFTLTWALKINFTLMVGIQDVFGAHYGH